jgi:hypothetical protein
MVHKEEKLLKMNAAQPSAHVQHQTEWQKLAETPVSFLLSDVGSGPVP